MNLNDLILELAIFVAILLGTFLAAKIFSLVVRGVFRNWVPAVRSHFQRLVSITIWVIGLIFAFQQLGLRLDFLLLILGLIGIGVLIAVKDTLMNIGAKYFSDVYVPFKVGDIIKVAGSTGKVIEINPITTVLLTKNEELVSIPNSLFLKEKMRNITPHVWKEILVPITIGSGIDLPQFESEVLKACNKIRKYLDERFPPVLTVKSRNQRSLSLVLALMVKEPDKKNEIIDEINRKISEIEQKMARKT
ncbi:MAG: mechanosensitive ion channel family protein [Candidatus Hadarchaeum sp.]